MIGLVVLLINEYADQFPEKACVVCKLIAFLDKLFGPFYKQLASGCDGKSVC